MIEPTTTHEIDPPLTPLERLSVLALGSPWRIEVTRGVDPIARSAVHHSARYAVSPVTGLRQYNRRTLDVAAPAQTRSLRAGLGPQAIAGALGMATASGAIDRWEADVAFALATDSDDRREAIIAGLDPRLCAVMNVRALKANQRAPWHSICERAYIAAQRGIPGRGKGLVMLTDGLALPPRFARQSTAAAVALLLQAADLAAGEAIKHL